MRHLLGSLPFRIGAIFLIGFIALQVAILFATVWPDGRPLMYRLVDPADAREIAEAMERVPQNLRPLIARAASDSATTVQLFGSERELAATSEALRSAPRLEERFARYATELEGRPVQIQVREDSGFSRLIQADQPPRGPMRIVVTLRTGELLTIERAPIVLQLLASRYLVVALVAAGVLALLLLVVFWQVIRPLDRLVRATEELSRDIAVPDVSVGGAHELRALGASFNSMKDRIGGLVAERTRMLAAIAHDMRTYLTRLRLRSEHIGEERHRRRAIEDIEEMSLLLDDVLLFAQTDACVDGERRRICAREEATGYVALRKEAGDDVSLAAADPVLPCACGPLAFRRILANLIDNAIRYGTRARVELEAMDDPRRSIALSVTDDGPGISEEMLVRITEPFERLEGSRSRHSGGAGLGLSIVKALVESHGGSLELENREAGGLRAIVRLPGLRNNPGPGSPTAG